MAQYARITGPRLLQSPVRQYRHPETGRQVTIVGTCHVGTPAYYTDLRTVIDKLEADGAVVHIEGSRLLPCDQPDISTREQQLLNQRRQADDLEQQRLPALGWTGQIDGLGYQPQWQIIDLSYLDILRRTGEPAWQKATDVKTGMWSWAQDDIKTIRRYRLLTTIALRVATNERRMTRPSRDPMDTVLTRDRTQVALDGIASTEQDTVAVWGIHHLPALDTGLQALGLHRTGEPDWHTIGQLPKTTTALWQWLTTGTRYDRASRR